MHTEITCDGITVLSSVGTLPDLYPQYRAKAQLADEFDLSHSDAGLSFFGVVRDSGWPILTIVQRYSPSQAGFIPGAIFVPETSTFFVGAGERLLAYNIDNPRRLWVDSTRSGFWRWYRHEEFILMAAELEFAVWSFDGQKRWSTFVEPPWDFEIHGPNVTLNVMGKISSMDIRYGPETKGLGHNVTGQNASVTLIGSEQLDLIGHMPPRGAIQFAISPIPLHNLPTLVI